ncbi:hypothetical protein Vadar_008117 [Vaccinium darrowii]|nr:hypothetical protein Vadar_008117 [Vaccinium darrowii]
MEEEKVKYYEENRSRIDKQEKLIQYTETKAGQIVASYILIVAIMFSSMTWSSSSSVSWRIQWFLFFQILLISAIFWLAITRVMKRLLRAKYHYEESLIEQEMLGKEIYMIRSGHTKSAEQQQGGLLVKPDRVTLRQWYTHVYAVVSPLICFTLLTLYGCIVILLDGK